MGWLGAARSHRDRYTGRAEDSDGILHVIRNQSFKQGSA